MAAVGDLDGNGAIDLAVGAGFDNTGGTHRGAVYVLRLDANGTVLSSLKIASGTNGGPALADLDNFGSSVAAVGDLNGDGVTDLAVGAPAKGDGINPTPPGSVQVLFLERVNQPPTLANSIADQTAIVGVPFSFTIPANSATDPDGDPLTYFALRTNFGPSGFSLPGWLNFNPATRTFSGTPGIDDIEQFSVTVEVNDPSNSFIYPTFQLTVSETNLAPSFTKGTNIVSAGDGAVRTINGWATNISAGAGESQALDFQVTIPVANAGLFTTAPAIASDGTLTFTPKAAATGTVTVTVKLHDNGGTANGGADLSPAQTFTIQLTGLNKAPSFTKGTNPSANSVCSCVHEPSVAKYVSSGER